jgi:hypothetical protein
MAKCVLSVCLSIGFIYHQNNHLRWRWTVWLAVGVGGVDADGALVLVLEVPEVGVVGGGLASDTSASADEAGSNVDGVCISGFHVDGWECWEWSRCRLVVVCRVGARAAAWVVACEEERTCVHGLVILLFPHCVGGLKTYQHPRTRSWRS